MEQNYLQSVPEESTPPFNIEIRRLSPPTKNGAASTLSNVQSEFSSASGESSQLSSFYAENLTKDQGVKLNSLEISVNGLLAKTNQTNVSGLGFEDLQKDPPTIVQKKINKITGLGKQKTKFQKNSLSTKLHMEKNSKNAIVQNNGQNLALDPRYPEVFKPWSIEVSDQIKEVEQKPVQDSRYPTALKQQTPAYDPRYPQPVKQHLVQKAQQPQQTLVSAQIIQNTIYPQAKQNSKTSTSSQLFKQEQNQMQDKIKSSLKTRLSQKLVANNQRLTTNRKHESSKHLTNTSLSIQQDNLFENDSSISLLEESVDQATLIRDLKNMKLEIKMLEKMKTQMQPIIDLANQQTDKPEVQQILRKLTQHLASPSKRADSIQKNESSWNDEELQKFANISSSQVDLKYQIDQIRDSLKKVQDQCFKVTKITEHDSRQVKSLGIKVSENEENLQIQANKFAEELQELKLAIDQSKQDLQSKVTMKDIQEQNDQTRQVVFQKIHDSIALCAKKDACAEDQKKISKQHQRIDILLEEAKRVGDECQRKLEIFGFQFTQKLDRQELVKFQELIEVLPRQEALDHIMDVTADNLEQITTLCDRIKTEFEHHKEIIRRYDEILCDKASRHQLDQLRDELYKQSREHTIQFHSLMEKASKLPIEQQSQTLTQQNVPSTYEITKQINYCLLEQQNNVEKAIRVKIQQIKSELCAYVDSKMSGKVNQIDHQNDLKLKADVRQIQEIQGFSEQIHKELQCLVGLIGESFKLQQVQGEDQKYGKQNRIQMLIQQVNSILNSSFLSSSTFNSVNYFDSIKTEIKFTEENYSVVQNLEPKLSMIPPLEIPLVSQVHNYLPVSGRVKSKFSRNRFGNSQVIVPQVSAPPNDKPVKRSQIDVPSGVKQFVQMQERPFSPLDSARNPVLGNTVIQSSQYTAKQRMSQVVRQARNQELSIKPSDQNNLNCFALMLKTQKSTETDSV